MDKIVPGTLEFERKPITQESNTSKELQSFIFGSVSSLDILTDITSKLATKAREVGFEDAAKVVMSLQDIQIITSGLNRAVVEAEKIKALGEFEITINLKTAEPLHRKVKVVPLKIGS